MGVGLFEREGEGFGIVAVAGGAVGADGADVASYTDEQVFSRRVGVSSFRVLVPCHVRAVKSIGAEQMPANAARGPLFNSRPSGILNFAVLEEIGSRIGVNGSNATTMMPASQ